MDGCSPGEHVGSFTAADTRLLLEAVKSATDATKAIAEVAQLQARAEASCREVEAMSLNTKTMNDSTTVASTQTGPEKRAGQAGMTAPGALVISERVGSITLEEWEGMSEGRLKKLDDALKRIITGITVPPAINSWENIATVIHQELSKAGLQFAAVGDFDTYLATQDWDVAENVSSPDLARIRSVVKASKVQGGKHWYPDEMVRIVQRLMELRGFQT